VDSGRNGRAEILRPGIPVRDALAPINGCQKAQDRRVELSGPGEVRTVAGIGDHDALRTRNPPDECIANLKEEWQVMITRDDQRWDTQFRDLIERSVLDTAGFWLRVKEIATGVARPQRLV